MVARKSRHFANISLLVMGAGFVSTLPFHGSIIGNLLQGGFEAGVVGGLADWFAVTALFRHPLGLPIPHTALLPKNRKKITDSIVHMIEQDWLTKESIAEKIHQIKFTEKLLQVIDKELHSESGKKAIASLCKEIVGSINAGLVAKFLEKGLKSYLHSIEVAPVYQQIVKEVLQRNYHEKAFDHLLLKIKEATAKPDVRTKLGSIALQGLENVELEGFMQFALKSFIGLVNEDKLGGILQNLIRKGVDHLSLPDDKNRQSLIGFLQHELEKTSNNQQLHEELERYKTEFLDKWNPEETITNILSKMQQNLLALLDDEAFLDKSLMPFLTGMLDSIRQDSVRMEKLESWIQTQANQLIEKNHSKIGKLVEDNLDKLDTETLVTMVEEKVGTDLQWIRVNGAICGFIIGIILVGGKTLFGLG